MAIDFRSDQVQTNKIIVTGSNPQKTLLIYGIDADDSPPNQGNIDPSVFDTTVIGSDVFMFVSGVIGGKDGPDPGITVIGGDLHISGNLTIDGTGGGGSSGPWTELNSTNISTTSSVAHGFLTTTIGVNSHAEGYNTQAIGNYSHAEGYNSVAIGTGSLAVGLGTIAYGIVDGSALPTSSQAAFGKYNIDSNEESLFVVGDGLDSFNRHDILRVNSGSVQVTGSLFVNGIAITGAGALPQMQRVNLAGYNRTNLTSSVVIGYGYFNPTDYTGLTSIEFSALGMNMAGVSGGLDLYDQSTSTIIAQLTWSGNGTLTTGSYQYSSFSIPAAATPYEIHLSQSGAVNGGSNYSMVGFVNFNLRW